MLMRDATHSASKRSTAEECFSIWRLAGRKCLYDDGRGLRLIVRFLSLEVRLAGDLCNGDRFAYQIGAAADDYGAWAALAALRTCFSDSGSRWESPPERPGRTDLFHVRALQVLDGLAAGASQRDLAVAIFGGAAVARGWQPDSALRAQVRYLVRKAGALVEGEYRSLISAELRRTRPR